MCEENANQEFRLKKNRQNKNSINRRDKSK